MGNFIHCNIWHCWKLVEPGSVDQQIDIEEHESNGNVRSHRLSSISTVGLAILRGGCASKFPTD